MKHPWTRCALAGLLAIALRLALLPLIPIPEPLIHDEFSYLLGADTFASGRLTNPAHPMWAHFETFHVNQQPTYCSKYPPAQALFLAFGQKFFGHPWFGVCLSVGLLFAFLCWMLEAWVAPAYAFLATVAAIFEWGLATYWINSYWGGAVPALGGVLVMGAVPRLARRVATGPTLLGSVGLVLLANSRPYEGVLAAIATAGVLLWLARRQKHPLGAFLSRRTVAPFLLVAIPGAAATGYYNYRLTGSPVLFPYSVNQQTYAASPHLYFLPPIPTPVYHHEIIRKLWVEWDKDAYRNARANPLGTALNSIGELRQFYLSAAFAPAVLTGLVSGAGPEMLSMLAILILPLVGLMLAKVVLPHYLAPAFGIFPLLFAAGLAASRRSRLPWIFFLLLALPLASGVMRVAEVARHPGQSPLAKRHLVIEQLEHGGGRHLILVRYSPAHSIHAEWVYNRADIDGSTVVWARDMGEEKNRELLAYYRDRMVWLLQPDIGPTALTPYRAGL